MKTHPRFGAKHSRSKILPGRMLTVVPMGPSYADSRHVRLNGISVWWICFGAVETFFLILGMIFLYRKGHTSTLRIRGLPRTFAGLVLLRSYWVTVQIGYAVGPLSPEVAKF